MRSKFVSRRHLQISTINSAIYITDLGSSNGTLLNGRKLAPNVPTEWNPGDTLALTDVRLDLVDARLDQSQRGPGRASGSMGLTISSAVLRPGQLATLTLEYDGREPQRVYLEGHTATEGLQPIVSPDQVMLTPGVPMQVDAQVRPQRPFWFGGRYIVRFAAFTTQGLYASVEAGFQARFRYELLAAALLLLGCGGIPLAIAVSRALPTPVVVVNTAIPTATKPTETKVPTATTNQTTTGTATATTSATATSSSTATTTATTTSTPTSTATSTSTSSATSTSTTTPTITLSPTLICRPQCAQQGFNMSYQIQPGDTLFSIAQKTGTDAQTLAQVNCISNANQITAGTNICVRAVPSNLSVSSNCFTTPGSINTSYPFTYPQFIVTNNGGPMLTPDTAILTGVSGAVITVPFQLGQGQSQAFDQFGASGITAGTFTTVNSHLSASLNCMLPPPNLSMSAFCILGGAQLTISNSGGPMMSLDTLTIRIQIPGFLYTQPFSERAGQSEVFKFGGSGRFTFTTQNTGLSKSLVCP